MCTFTEKQLWRKKRKSERWGEGVRKEKGKGKGRPAAGKEEPKPEAEGQEKIKKIIGGRFLNIYS